MSGIVGRCYECERTTSGHCWAHPATWTAEAAATHVCDLEGGDGGEGDCDHFEPPSVPPQRVEPGRCDSCGRPWFEHPVTSGCVRCWRRGPRVDSVEPPASRPHAFYATRKGTPMGVAGDWANRCDTCDKGLNDPIHNAHRADLDAAVLRAVEGEPPASQRCCGAIVPAHDPGCYRYRPASQEGPSEGEHVLRMFNRDSLTRILDPDDRRLMVRLIDSALSSSRVAVRDEALEEAAKRAEQPRIMDALNGIVAVPDFGGEIAAAIRALKGGKP